jgi:TonB family protein
MLTKWSKEERFGLQVALGFHVILFLFLLFVKLDAPQEQRTAFIEVELGAFQMGSPAEYAPKKNQQVESRRVTSKNDSKERPQENKPVNQQNTQKSVDKTKPVDAPDQNEEILSDDVIKTPETEKITPDLSDKQQVKEEAIAPNVKKDELEKDGELKTGDIEGNKGDPNVKQGTGTDEDKTAPFSLKWEGDIERSPQVQPLPRYSQDLEAVITVRFEVRPDGTVARMLPTKKMNPDLEAEVLKTLRTWRFSRLPSGVPQQSQWGTITFRFVLQ